MEYFETIFDYFYEYIYEPVIRNYFPKQYNFSHGNNFLPQICIADEEIDKFINNTINEMKIDEGVKELELRMIKLNEPIVVCYDDDDHSNDDSNDNALKVKKILCKEK